MVHLLTLLLITLTVNWIEAVKFPADLPRCHKGDTNCISHIIDSYVRRFKDGRRDLNMLSIDPLQVNEIDISQGSDSAVNIHLNFKDVRFYGFSNIHVYRVVGFGKDPRTSKFEFYFKVNQLSLVGQYKVKGNVLFLPVVGSGPANLTLENIDASLKLIPKVEIKKGKQYLTIRDVKLDFRTTRLYMQFNNLFNGDKILSEGTNHFLNKNWLIILNELKPALKKGIGRIFKAVIGSIVAKFPYNDLFL